MCVYVYFLNHQHLYKSYNLYENVPKTSSLEYFTYNKNKLHNSVKSNRNKSALCFQGVNWCIQKNHTILSWDDFQLDY